MKRRSPKLVLLLTAIVSIGIGMLVGHPALIASNDADNARTPKTERVSVLERPAQSSDRLPDIVLQQPAAQRFDDPSDARLAFSDGERRYFVVPAVGGELCVIEVVGEGDLASGTATCNPRRRLAESAIAFTFQERTGSDIRVVALAADGFSSVKVGATEAPVRDNVGVVSVPASDSLSLRLIAENGAVRAVDLGSQRRPAAPQE
jgi:hypothetical protein